MTAGELGGMSGHGHFPPSPFRLAGAGVLPGTVQRVALGVGRGMVLISGAAKIMLDRMSKNSRFTGSTGKDRHTV